MLDKNRLRASWVAKGLTQAEVAKKIEMSPSTFNRKIKNGTFGTDEAQLLIELLDINDPQKIFFAKSVT